MEIPASEERDRQEIGKEVGPIPEESKEEGKHKTEIKETILSEKPRWSWGWLFLLLFFSVGILSVNTGPISDRTRAIITVVQIVGVALLLFLYFKFRKMLIKKAHFRQIWLSSFTAGIISYLVCCFLTVIPIALIARNDQSAEIGKLRKIKYEITGTIVNLNKEEIGLWGSFINEPSTAKDVENNKQVLSKLLIMLDNKAKAISRLVNNAKETDNYSKNKLQYVGMYDKLKGKTDEYLNIYKKGVQLYLEYYKTFDEKKFNEGTDLLAKADLLLQDLQGEIAKIIGEWRNDTQ